MDEAEISVGDAEVHPLVGVPDGYVDQNGETVMYEYAEDGSFVGWHKEPKA